MKYFIDTEFHEEPCTIELISIGIVAEDGREFSATAEDGWSPERCNQWVHENVLPNLDGFRLTREQIRLAILEFVGNDPKPEFWGYYADYDWVAFCWLFGSMVQLPKRWPMFCRDVKQLADSMGNPELPYRNDRHNALGDAHYIYRNYCWLMDNYPTPERERHHEEG